MWRKAVPVEQPESIRAPAAPKTSVRSALRSRYPYEGQQALRNWTVLLHLKGLQLQRESIPHAGFLQICGVLLGMLVVYGALLAAIGTPARVHEPLWCVSCVWICAQAAGYIASKVHAHYEQDAVGMCTIHC